MIVVIIAGGSGTRLWPLSTPDYPKHLLKLTGTHSLLHYTYERAAKIADKVYVITESSHAKHVKEQLPMLPEDSFIIEPGRRGTASCIVAALHMVAKKHEPTEPIAFLAADHYIRDTNGFVHSMAIAGTISTKENKIVLIGAEPDHPATGFGYIQKDGLIDEKRLVYKVDSFKEKPDYKTAKKYVDSGNYLWNCGYFVGSTEVFLKTMEKSAPELYQNLQKLNSTTTRTEYEKAYLRFENNSIDYALIERVKDLLVVQASFDWMDLGSFGDLHKAAGSDEQGNHILGDKVEIAGVENSLIRNHEDKPVAVIGLDNVAVINTPHGLLVTRKDLAQQVGEISKKFNAKL